MSAPRRYDKTTPEKVQACLAAGMSTRRAAQVLNVGESALRQACSLFGWTSRGWSGPKPNNKTLQPKKPLPKRGAHNPFGV